MATRATSCATDIWCRTCAYDYALNHLRLPSCEFLPAAVITERRKLTATVVFIPTTSLGPNRVGRVLRHVCRRVCVDSPNASGGRLATNCSPERGRLPRSRLSVGREFHTSKLGEICFSGFAMPSSSCSASRAVWEGLGARDDYLRRQLCRGELLAPSLGLDRGGRRRTWPLIYCRMALIR
jgi:hypothetical protein